MAPPVSATVLRALNALWCIVVVAYVGYGWYAYAGVYRVFAEWQIATFGSYRVLLTALLPALALMLPSLWIGVRLQRAGARPQGTAPDPRRHLRIIAITGLTALVVAAVAAAVGYTEAHKVLTVAPFDLRRSATLPTADRFVVTGVARTDLMLRLETESRGGRTIEAYVPLTAAEGPPGPLAYFLKTNQTAWVPPGGGRVQRLARDQAPFLMTTQPAVVESHSLPGPLREAYRNNNVTLATQVHVFSQNTAEGRYLYWAVAGVGALVGLVCLLVTGLIALGLRRRRA